VAAIDNPNGESQRSEAGIVRLVVFAIIAVALVAAFYFIGQQVGASLAATETEL